MNNNRNNANNNNRRRGRGNRNQGGGGSGNQGNRIDSRARGNAPQMLDKFKKLAEDAHRHGDRVQAEYYLQFADHYFRVIADNRSRQEEPRGDQRFGRRDEREQDDFAMDDENDADAGGRYDSPRESVRDTQRENPREGQSEGQREQRPRRDERPRNRYEERANESAPSEADDTVAFEPDENPFMREMRDDTAPRPKRAPRPRRGNGQGANGQGANGQEPGIDAAVLPPAFSANDTGERDGEAGAEAAPRRRRKRSDGETLSAVG